MATNAEKIQTDCPIQAMARRGWQLMPIATKQKNPGTLLGTGWQDQASNDPEQVERWIEQHGQCNWGVSLGEASGIIDVEDDSPEGRSILETAMDTCSVRTPCYTSGKSIHRLFKYDERIHADSCSVMQAFGTEWRFGKTPAQSVVPPSVHESEKRYQWLNGLSPDEVEVARLPDAMWQLFLDLRILDGKRKAEEREKKRSQTKSEKKPISASMQLRIGGHTTHVPAAEELIEMYPWEKLLIDQEWQAFGDDDWTRPGSDWSNARSATLLHSDNRLHVWSNAAPIDEGHYSKWRFWYQSHGFNDHEQINAAKAFLGDERSGRIDAAFRREHKLNDSTVPEQSTDKQASVQFRSFAGIDASELTSYASQEADWLVQDVFTIDEPLLVGARSKGCKTLQLTDLAVAVASVTKWMNIFNVPKRRKVLFITGEANYRRIAKHIEKACRVRGIDFHDLKDFLRIEAIEFPCLPRIKDQEAIRRDIEKHGFEVVIVDPLYRGLSGLDSSRLSEMGDAIKSFQAACSPACMVLSHHVVKSAAREYGRPPELEDMTGAGIAESCGQWWLVGRNEPYAWNWQHDLCIQFGGREGQGGGRRILFNEHYWTFQVDHWHEYTEQAQTDAQTRKEDVRRKADEQKRTRARVLILKAVRNIKTPQSKNSIEQAAGAVQADFRIVFAEMVQEQLMIQRPYRDSLKRLQPCGYLLTDYVDEYDKTEVLVDVR